MKPKQFVLSTIPSRLVAMLLAASLVAVCAVAMTGCAVTPSGAVVVDPVGVAYVEPTYAIPGPGYEWHYHPAYGWGWHHPYYGWHRGWR
jgi:hypothetical protein